MTTTGKNRFMIYGPKDDATYVIEFRTAGGEALAISIPNAGDRVPCGRGLVARLIDRARGCSTAAAAQQSPPGCFTVEMSHSRA
jgi:hypothetical protein